MLDFIIRKHRMLWSDRRFLHSALLGLVMITVGLLAAAMAMEHLVHALHAQWGPDLILDNLPVLKLKDSLVWGMELLLFSLICLLILFPEYIPYTLKTIGLLYLIRAFFVILTPLGSRPDQIVETTTQGLFASLAYSSNDFFFSGHVAFPFMLALIFWEKEWIRYSMIGAAMFFSAAVLLAHTHYSIDVFAVFFIIPTIYAVSLRLFDHDIRYASGDSADRTDHV